MGALGKRPQLIEAAIRFVAVSINFGVQKSHCLRKAVDSVVEVLEANVNVTPELFETAIVLVEPPVDRCEQLLIRHNLKLPRPQRRVKKLSPV